LLKLFSPLPCLLLAAVVIANERRSESVQAAFVELFSPSFTFKKVPLSKQDPDYCHPAIEIYILKKKKGASDANLVELERQLQGPQSMHQQQQEPHQEECQTPTDVGQEGLVHDVSRSLQFLSVQQQQQQQQQQQDELAQQLSRQNQGESSRSSQHNVGESGQAEATKPLCPGNNSGVSWDSRRKGSEAARLLTDISVPTSGV
jgi:hypothetical protein